MVDQPTLTPIVGPPNLEGVPDRALFVVRFGGNTYTEVWCKKTAMCELPARTVDWHIPLGVIGEPAEPETTE